MVRTCEPSSSGPCGTREGGWGRSAAGETRNRSTHLLRGRLLRSKRRSGRTLAPERSYFFGGECAFDAFSSWAGKKPLPPPSDAPPCPACTLAGALRLLVGLVIRDGLVLRAGQFRLGLVRGGLVLRRLFGLLLLGHQGRGGQLRHRDAEDRHHQASADERA